MKTCDMPKILKSSKSRTNTERAANADLYPPVTFVIEDLILKGIVEGNLLKEQTAKVIVF